MENKPSLSFALSHKTTTAAITMRTAATNKQNTHTHTQNNQNGKKN